jgi:hypothetical protein
LINVQIKELRIVAKDADFQRGQLISEKQPVAKTTRETNKHVIVSDAITLIGRYG